MTLEQETALFLHSLPGKHAVIEILGNCWHLGIDNTVYKLKSKINLHLLK